MRLEAAGHRILKLNTGNPAAFGFECPPEILEDIAPQRSPTAHGYGDAKGLLVRPPRGRAALPDPRASTWTSTTSIIGNGVSELIQMAMQALLDDGDEVLVPAPDYPLWTAAVSLSGGTRGALPLRRAVRLDAGPRRHRARRSPTAPRRSSSSTRTTRPARCTTTTMLRGLDGHRPPPRPAGLLRRDLRQDPVRRRHAHLDRHDRPRPADAHLQRHCRRRTGWPATAAAGWRSAGPQHARHLATSRA